MVKITLPNDLPRSVVGFDAIMRSLESELDSTLNATYPPYDLEITGENKYEIRVAVAGFSKDELEVVYQNGYLTVQTKVECRNFEKDQKKKAERGSSFLHNGIAKRAWRLRWKLLETIEVVGADQVDGILTVYLENIIPDSKKPRNIEIGTTKPQLLNE